jgi:hypothetical protein
MTRCQTRTPRDFGGGERRSGYWDAGLGQMGPRLRTRPPGEALGFQNVAKRLRDTAKPLMGLSLSITTDLCRRSMAVRNGGTHGAAASYARQEPADRIEV